MAEPLRAPKIRHTLVELELYNSSKRDGLVERDQVVEEIRVGSIYSAARGRLRLSLHGSIAGRLAQQECIEAEQK